MSINLLVCRYLAYDIIGEIGFGAPFGFIKTASDVSNLIKAFEDGAPIFGLLGRLYPFTMWIKKTWIGQKYLVAKPEDKSGWGAFMRIRDKLIDRRKTDLKAGTLGGRVDLLQTFVFLSITSLSLEWTRNNHMAEYSMPVQRTANLSTPNMSKPRLFSSLLLERTRQGLPSKV